MEAILHRSMAELEAGMDEIRGSPRDDGILKMIVRRPTVDAREVVETAQLDPLQGLVGDSWKSRGSRHTPDRSADINAQITIMNARTIALLAQDSERWPLAGDQLYIDLNLGADNLPPGMRLAIGTAVLEVTAQPHTGCKKFSARFGIEAMKFVNSTEGKRLHLRGINARVVRGGTIRAGDRVTKIP